MAGKAIQEGAVDAPGVIAAYGGHCSAAKTIRMDVCARERLAARFASTGAAAGAVFESAGAYAERSRFYEAGWARTAWLSRFYQGQMRCYLALEQPAKPARLSPLQGDTVDRPGAETGAGNRAAA